MTTAENTQKTFSRLLFLRVCIG